jgi:hypothetical protein
MYVVAEFIDAVTKNLLTLFVDEIQVVQHNYFFAVRYDGTSLAECFDVGPVIVDTLLLETVYKEHVLGVCLLVTAFIILSDEGIHQRRLSRSHVPNQRYV